MFTEVYPVNEKEKQISMCCLFWIAGMLTAIAAMLAAVIAWFAAPYLLLAGIIVWLTLHKIAFVGFAGLFFLICGVARIIPVRATQLLAAASVLAIVIGWNIYTPGDVHASTTAATTPVTETLLASSPSPSPSPIAETTPTPDNMLLITSPPPTPSPTPSSKHIRVKNHAIHLRS